MITLNSLQDYTPTHLLIQEVKEVKDLQKPGHFLYAPGMPYHGLEIVEVDDDADLILQLKENNPKLRPHTLCLTHALKLVKEQKIYTCELKPNPEPIIKPPKGMWMSPTQEFFMNNGKHYTSTIEVGDTQWTLHQEDLTRLPIVREVNSDKLDYFRLDSLKLL